MEYSAILYLDKQITEGGDNRFYATRPGSGSDRGLDNPQSINWNDPKLWSATAFGANLQSRLQGLGTGFNAKVVDFKRWVTATVSYTNNVTGKTAEKIFLVVFDKPTKGDGIVLSTANRYRSISGVDQAATYIKSASSSLKDATNSVN